MGRMGPVKGIVATLRPDGIDSRGDRTIANARLIAAAPELLAAAKRAQAFMNRCIGNGGSTEGQNTTLREEEGALFAAIAKVEGRKA